MKLSDNLPFNSKKCDAIPWKIPFMQENSLPNMPHWFIVSSVSYVLMVGLLLFFNMSHGKKMTCLNKGFANVT